MKILLTGAGGFVGSHVARKLRSRGLDVRLVIRPGSNLHRLEPDIDMFRIVRLDLADSSSLGRAIADDPPDACVHLAWPAVRGDLLDSPEHLRAARITLDLAAHLVRAGCTRLLVAGSCFEYVFGPNHLTETSPVKAKNLYTGAKLALLNTLGKSAAGQSLNLIWPRLFFLYGPGEDPRRLVPAVIRSLLACEEAKVTAGEQIRDFLHIDDAADGIARLALSNVTGPVNLCSTRPVAVRDVIAEIASQLGRAHLVRYGALPYRPDDPPIVVGDNTRMTSLFGWKPNLDLPSGLAETIQWWRRNSVGEPALN